MLQNAIGDSVGELDRAQFVFGITSSEADLIFDYGAKYGAQYGKDDVAKRIRQVAAKYDGKPV